MKKRLCANPARTVTELVCTGSHSDVISTISRIGRSKTQGQGAVFEKEKFVELDAKKALTEYENCMCQKN